MLLWNVYGPFLWLDLLGETLGKKDVLNNLSQGYEIPQAKEAQLAIQKPLFLRKCFMRWQSIDGYSWCWAILPSNGKGRRCLDEDRKREPQGRVDGPVPAINLSVLVFMLSLL